MLQSVFTVNGQRLEHSIYRSTPFARWSSDIGRAKGNSEETQQLNYFLDVLTTKALKIEREMIQEGQTIIVDRFREKWLSVHDHPRMLPEIFQEHNDQAKTPIGKDFSSGILERYNTSLDHTQSFLKFKGIIFRGRVKNNALQGFS